METDKQVSEIADALSEIRDTLKELTGWKRDVDTKVEAVNNKVQDMNTKVVSLNSSVDELRLKIDHILLHQLLQDPAYKVFGIESLDLPKQGAAHLAPTLQEEASRQFSHGVDMLHGGLVVEWPPLTCCLRSQVRNTPLTTSLVPVLLLFHTMLGDLLFLLWISLISMVETQKCSRCAVNHILSFSLFLCTCG